MPTKHAKILVLENDTAITLALSRLNFGENISFQFAPSDFIPVNDPITYAAVLGDDNIFTGGGDKPPIEELRKTLSCPIILMTTSPSPRLAHAAREAGAAAVLQKPFGISDLRKALASALHKDIPSQSATTITANSTAPPNTQQPYNHTPTHALAPVGDHVAPDAVFDQLFTELERRQPLEEGLDAFDIVERHLIRRALQACDGNQSQAARFLGITRNTLRKRIRKYDFGSLLIKDEEPES